MGVAAVNSPAEFRQYIDSSKPVIIEFWAEWCGPCRVISPIFERFSSMDQFSGIVFLKVDVDAQADISQEVGIRSMPTFMVFKDGNKVAELVGANPPGLEQLVRRAAELAA